LLKGLLRRFLKQEGERGKTQDDGMVRWKGGVLNY